MKKLLSVTLIVSMLASLSVLPVSASSVNEYELSYNTLTTALTTNSGETIPAGAVAISATIENNTGFNANTITLDVGTNCTIVTDIDGNPIVEAGTVLDDAMIGMAANEEIICVTTASSQACVSDGELFTIFVMPDISFCTDDVTIGDIQQVTAQASPNQGMLTLPDSNGLNSWRDPDTHVFYIVRGDLDNNNVVNSADATVIMQAYANVTPKYDDDEDAILSRFPSVLVWYQADANGDGVVSHLAPDYPQFSDAETILMYSAAMGADGYYTGYGYQYIGKWYNTDTGLQEDPNM